MNVGSMGGVNSSAAGAPLSQTSGSEVERSQQQSSIRERKVESESRAEKSAGIGETEQDQGASDRDADGRRLWESLEENPSEQDVDSTERSRQAKDPSGDCGSALDLTG